MSRKCLICSHSARLLMEREYMRGKSISGIARRYQVGSESLRNHLNKHTSRQLAQAYQKKAEVEGLELLSDIDELVSITKKILTRADEKEHDITALKPNRRTMRDNSSRNKRRQLRHS